MEPTVSPVDGATTIFAALRDRDLSIFQRADHRDVVADFVAIGQFRGVAAVQGFFAELFAAFPDFEISIINAIGDDDHALSSGPRLARSPEDRFRGFMPRGRGSKCAAAM